MTCPQVETTLIRWSKGKERKMLGAQHLQLVLSVSGYLSRLSGQPRRERLSAPVGAVDSSHRHLKSFRTACPAGDPTLC